MELPTCNTCPYFDPPHVLLTGGMGECRAHPEFRPKRKIDWCGEHPDFKAFIATLKPPASAMPEVQSEATTSMRELTIALYELNKELGLHPL